MAAFLAAGWSVGRQTTRRSLLTISTLKVSSVIGRLRTAASIRPALNSARIVAVSPLEVLTVEPGTSAFCKSDAL